MKTFLLLHDFGDIIKMLSDSEAGQIFKAVFDYEINAKVPEFSDRTMQIVFFDIKRFLDSNRENYEKVCKQRSEYAKKRWSEKNSQSELKLKDAKACISMHKHTAVGNDNVNADYDDNADVNVNVCVNSNAEQTGPHYEDDTNTQKQAYGMFNNVYLTEDEYKLVKTCLAEGERRLDSFSAYMKALGKDYNDHYARLINWSCYDDAPVAASNKKQPGERREPTFDVSEFKKKALDIKFVPPEED